MTIFLKRQAILIPDLHQDKRQRLAPIPGSPPDMTNPPPGCPFAPRCPYARRICKDKLPEFVECGQKHQSRCFLLYPDAPADEHNPFCGRGKKATAEMGEPM